MSGVSNNILHSNKMNALRRVGFVKFPPPKGINVNMMPFVIGDPKSIPSAIRDYYSIIEACPIPSTELGKIGYISVSESVIPKNNSQRRPGIHTERSHPGERWGGWGRGRRHGWGHDWEHLRGDPRRLARGAGTTQGSDADDRGLWKDVQPAHRLWRHGSVDPAGGVGRQNHLSFWGMEETAYALPLNSIAGSSTAP